jgi:hypothetical protein
MTIFIRYQENGMGKKQNIKYRIKDKIIDTYANMFISIYIHVYTYISIPYTYIHTYMYACTLIHIYIHEKPTFSCAPHRRSAQESTTGGSVRCQTY